MSAPTELHSRELDALVGIYEGVAAGGKGSLVFVSGEEGSGRRLLLHDFAREIRRGRSQPVLVAGALVGESFEPWPEQQRIGRKAADLVVQAVGAAPLGAIVGVAAQLVGLSRAAWELANDVSRGAKSAASPVAFLPRLLQLAARERPVVCLLDTDEGGDAGLWGDLVSGVAKQISVDLPLMICLTTGLPPRSEAEAQLATAREEVVQHLVADGLARQLVMPTASAADVLRWLGPSDAAVVEALVSVTGGRRGWIEELWGAWLSEQVVEARAGRWRFSDPDAADALSWINGMLTRRLRALVGDDPSDLRRIRQQLEWGALEGRRFTGDAVAFATSMDRDDTIDDLDRVSDDGPSRNAVPLLRDIGSIVVAGPTGDRTLWRYEFASRLDWLALRHYGRTAAEDHGRLALALEEQYGFGSKQIAPLLARLYRGAGDSVRADHHDWIAEVGVSNDVLFMRARSLLTDVTQESEPWERTRAALILIAAARHCTVPRESLRFALAARALADSPDTRAKATLQAGAARLHLDEVNLAAVDVRAAHEAFEALGDRMGQAHATHMFAVMARFRGDLDEASQQFAEVLGISRDLDDRLMEAAALSELAGIDEGRSEFRSARTRYERALELRISEADLKAASAAHRGIARVAHSQGNYPEARLNSASALDLALKSDDRMGTIDAHHLHGAIAVAEREYELALVHLSHERELRRELGFTDAGDHNDHMMGVVMSALGRLDEARDHLLRALDERQRLGRPHDAATTLFYLGDVAMRQGQNDVARVEFTRALGVQRDLGDRHNEAETQHLLGRIELDAGAHALAREHFTRSAELRAELGDPAGEALDRFHLATLDHIEGDRDRARAQFERLLPLVRRLGQPDMVGLTAHSLGVIAVEQRRWSQARKMFEQVLTQLPNREIPTREALAHISDREGRRSEARAHRLRLVTLYEDAGDVANAARVKSAIR